MHPFLDNFCIMPEVNLRWKTEENENTKEKKFITIGKYSSGNEGGDSKRKRKLDWWKERTGKNEIFIATQMVVLFKLIETLEGGLK